MEVGKERPLEYDKVVNVEDMPWNPITDRQIAGLGSLQPKPEGQQFPLDQPILGGTKSYEASAYALAVEFSWEAWRDELYGVARELTTEQARAGRNRQELSGWSAFNNAFSTSFAGFTSGEALCSTAHVGLDGASRANRPSPDIALSVTGLQSSLTRFENMTDERGLPRLMAPTRLICGPSNKFVAREILGSTSKPYTTDNEINALIEDDLSWMISHYLTTAGAWFTTAAQGVHDLNFLWRDRPIFDSFDDPWTKNAIFTTYQRHTDSQYGSWRGIDGSFA
jgi:hypothetical protein